MEPIYQVCSDRAQPLVVHAGREPRSPAYPVDPWEICSADRVAAVLRNFPGLALCVPHLGADEFGAYAELLERHDNLWLDTTMVLADYFPGPPPRSLLTRRPERILYGTDFPNIPYAWDRELVRIAGMGLSDQLPTLLAGAARALFGIAPA